MKEFLQRLIKYLRRDIRTLFKPPAIMDSAEKPRMPNNFKDSLLVEEKSTIEAKNLPLPLILDPTTIDRIRFRRQILDWRDNAILQLNRCANLALQDFSDLVATKLKVVTVWRRVLPKPANEVLLRDFDNLVRARILTEVQQTERQLKKISSGEKSSKLQLIDEYPDSQLSYIAKMKFKPSNKAAILKAISHLVLGEHGITDKLNQQIMSIALEMIEKI